MIGLLGAGDFFGENCLAGQSTRIATAEAMANSSIIRMERGAFMRALRNDPAFTERFVTHLLARIIRVEADLIDQLFNSSEKRLARVLLLLCNFGKKERPQPRIDQISQHTLAEMIGTTRSRVSVFMNKFRRQGFIDYDDEYIEVHSSLSNALLQDELHVRDNVIQVDRVGTRSATSCVRRRLPIVRSSGLVQHHRALSAKGGPLRFGSRRLPHGPR